MKIDLKVLKIEVVWITPTRIKKAICKYFGHRAYFVKGYGGYCFRCKKLLGGE